MLTEKAGPCSVQPAATEGTTERLFFLKDTEKNKQTKKTVSFEYFRIFSLKLTPYNCEENVWILENSHPHIVCYFIHCIYFSLQVSTDSTSGFINWHIIQYHYFYSWCHFILKTCLKTGGVFIVVFVNISLLKYMK